MLLVQIAKKFLALPSNDDPPELFGEYLNLPSELLSV